MKASRTFRVSVGDLAARSGVLFTGVGRRQAIPTRDLARPEPPTDIWALGAPIRHYVCRAEGPLRTTAEPGVSSRSCRLSMKSKRGYSRFWRAMATMFRV